MLLKNLVELSENEELRENVGLCLNGRGSAARNKSLKMCVRVCYLCNVSGFDVRESD